ncbi:glutathione S-transferase family protein [Roseovarius dicentrarchi]|uniref:glutathione S-transferase family protein n=1 Tax=Roseovarius dicentrarchi TaxID=2250573 RepID=UPI000DE90DD9|nr:glutathione S-transferase [Roseovarius dicentrarchi]
MKLFYSPNSPFVRKVLMTGMELGLDDRIERVQAAPHPVNRDRDLIAHNPLGQIPACLTDDGEEISDSRVICEYLAALVPDQQIFPSGPRRWAALTEQSISDGLMAAALSIRYERSTRPAEQQSQTWIAGQTDKIETVLDALDRRYVRPPPGFDIGHISVACAIDYLAFRFPEITLGSRWPHLADYHALLDARPSFAQTIPPDSPRAQSGAASGAPK